MSRYIVFLFVSFICLLLVSFSEHVSASFVFSRDLRFGDTGNDVYELQKALNLSEKTFVAISGPGSPGNETTYFGEATTEAVKKFQQEYAQEVLVPQGLLAPSGAFDSLSRAKLNMLVGGTQDMTGHTVEYSLGKTPGSPLEVSAEMIAYMQERLSSGFIKPHTSSTTQTIQDISNVTQFNFFTEADNKKVQLAFVSANTVARGGLLTLTGTGFTPTNNNVHLGSQVVSGVLAQDSNTIVFSVPESVTPGVYDIEVSNAKGKSESNSYVVITADETIVPPRIISVFPTFASLGDTVTITGENFTTTGNTIHSTLGTFSNVASSENGTKISFTLKAPAHLPDLSLLLEYAEDYEFKVFVYVVNEYGSSDKYAPGIVTLQ